MRIATWGLGCAVLIGGCQSLVGIGDYDEAGATGGAGTTTGSGGMGTTTSTAAGGAGGAVTSSVSVGGSGGGVGPFPCPGANYLGQGAPIDAMAVTAISDDIVARIRVSTIVPEGGGGAALKTVTWAGPGNDVELGFEYSGSATVQFPLFSGMCVRANLGGAGQQVVLQTVGELSFSLTDAPVIVGTTPGATYWLDGISVTEVGCGRFAYGRVENSLPATVAQSDPIESGAFVLELGGFRDLAYGTKSDLTDDVELLGVGCSTTEMVAVGRASSQALTFGPKANGSVAGAAVYNGGLLGRLAGDPNFGWKDVDGFGLRTSGLSFPTSGGHVFATDFQGVLEAFGSNYNAPTNGTASLVRWVGSANSVHSVLHGSITATIEDTAIATHPTLAADKALWVAGNVTGSGAYHWDPGQDGTPNSGTSDTALLPGGFLARSNLDTSGVDGGYFETHQLVGSAESRFLKLKYDGLNDRMWVVGLCYGPSTLVRDGIPAGNATPCAPSGSVVVYRFEDARLPADSGAAGWILPLDGVTALAPSALELVHGEAWVSGSGVYGGKKVGWLAKVSASLQ